MSKHFRELKRLAGQIGIRNAHIEPKGKSKHAKLHGRVAGQDIKVPVPETPSCWRSMANYRAHLRRIVREKRAQ